MAHFIPAWGSLSLDRAVGAYGDADTTSGVARGWYELGLWPAPTRDRPIPVLFVTDYAAPGRSFEIFKINYFYKYCGSATGDHLRR